MSLVSLALEALSVCLYEIHNFHEVMYVYIFNFVHSGDLSRTLLPWVCVVQTLQISGVIWSIS